jgi:nitroreductase
MAMTGSREDAMATHTGRAFERGTFDTIHRRRAVRSYTPDKLDESTVRRLLEAAVQAPTAMHLEPWAFVVIQDVGLLERLSDQAKVLAQAAVEEDAGHRNLVKAPGVPAASDLLALLANPSFNIFYDASTLIVICGKPLGRFVTADCWLAAENLMLAACAIDLGTCCIGFAVPVLNTPDVKRELGIPADATAIAPIIVGVPKGITPPVGRKAPDVLRWVRSA